MVSVGVGAEASAGSRPWWLLWCSRAWALWMRPRALNGKAAFGGAVAVAAAAAVATVAVATAVSVAAPLLPRLRSGGRVAA